MGTVDLATEDMLTLDGRPAELIDSGLMDDGPILDGRPAELIDSRVDG
jgi:hypothetical protein